MRRNGWKRDGENDEVDEDVAVDEGRSPNADELTAGDLATVSATESDSGNRERHRCRRGVIRGQ